MSYIPKNNKPSDEYYTPEHAILPLARYVKSNSTIWCPFDTEDSNYVKIFKEWGHTVINTHIDYGQDFLSYEPDIPYDYIISNPPFSIKDRVLERLSELRKPFAVLFPLTVLQGVRRFPYLKNTEVMIFDKRINFWKNKEKTEMVKGVPFASIYVCNNFLPEKLIFEELKEV